MQGIIADVSPTRVQFVSLLGNRVAVPLARLRTTWHFVQGVPRRTLPVCERVGCGNAGMIEFTRANRQEYACPKHAPSNIQCHITANYQVPLAPRTTRQGFECRSTPCPMCGDPDPAEDVRITAHPARLWVCSACNGRWVTVPRTDEAQNLEELFGRIYHELSRWHNEIESIQILQPLSWAELRSSERVVQPDPSETIPRITLPNGLQASLNITIMTEQIRGYFHAIVRVRATTVRQGRAPVQRLGGSPNRGGVVGSTTNPVRPVAVPNDPMIFRATGVAAETVAAAASALHRLRREEAAPEVPCVSEVAVDQESVWVQRTSGDHVIVVEVVKATDGSDVVVFCRGSAEGNEPTVSMSRQDFLTYHRVYVPASESAAPAKPLIGVSINEEWECKDGSAMLITQVDPRREVVYGDDIKTKKHRSIPFQQFLAGRWRKVVRLSVYDRIRRPEINLAPVSVPEEEE